MIGLGTIRTLAMNFITAPDPTRAHWLKRYTRTDDTHFVWHEQRQIQGLTHSTGEQWAHERTCTGIRTHAGTYAIQATCACLIRLVVLYRSAIEPDTGCTAPCRS